MAAIFDMPLNVALWIADTQGMSVDEEGVYLRLCLCMWQKKGILPDDDLLLSRFARVSKAKWLKKYRPVLEVEGLFYSENGYFLHKKVQKTFEKVSKKVEQNRVNGRKGGRPKPLINNKTTKPNGSIPVNPNDKPNQSNLEIEQDIERSKVKNNTKKPKRASSISKDWKPSQDFVDHCETKYPLVDSLLELEKFKDHWISNGDTKKDWLAAWRNWLRNGFNPIMKSGAISPNKKFTFSDQINSTMAWAEEQDRKDEENGE